MKCYVYSVRDARTGFLTPTVEVSDQVARRNFEHAIASGPSLFTSHPEDYSLWCIGSFDTDTGELSPVTPGVLLQATDVLNRLGGDRRGES